MHENSNHEMNNLTLKDNELNCTFNDPFELKEDYGQSTKLRNNIQETTNQSTANSTSDSATRNTNVSFTKKVKVNKLRNLKKCTTSSSQGIIGSIKSWAYSLITHSPKRIDQNRRHTSPRNIDVLTNEEINTEGFNRTPQTEVRNSDIFHINISDEELARRMQIEELNNLGALQITEDGLSLPSHSLGSFRDTNCYPNITVSSSSNISINPFQGIPYKFEFRSSDDEKS